MAALLEATGGRVDHVRIASLRENVWYSVIDVHAGARSVKVDARPSDAVNLAVRVGAPILVAEEVMSELAFPIDQVSERLEQWQRSTGRDVPEPGHWRPLSPSLISKLRDAAVA